MAFCLGDSILANFVEQGFVADLQHAGCLFAVPVGLLECLANGFAFGFVFCAARHRFQPAGISAPAGIGMNASAVTIGSRLQFRSR
jgi:hypothetical protein